MVNKPSPSFFQRVTEIDRKTGCWNWQRYAQSKGYGQFRWRGVMTLAHRASFLVHKGPIPEGLHVLHRCDNRLCCNPKHLFLGTPRDNMQDALHKGRLSSSGSRLPRVNKLTDDQVRRIREGGEVPKVLAAELGIARCTIYQIRNGKRKQLVQ